MDFDFWATVQGISIGTALLSIVRFEVSRRSMVKARATYYNSAIQLDEAAASYRRLGEVKGAGRSLTERLAEKKVLFPKGDVRNDTA